MNFYKHHIGDYDADTAHLSMLEDAAYSRLMRAYYRTEKPIPADTKAACRLVRATTKPEREAVSVVLNEFFTLEADGWHNKRCDEELSAYIKQSETNRAIAVARERKRKEHDSLNGSSPFREPSQNPESINQNQNPEPLATNQELQTQNQRSKTTPRADKPRVAIRPESVSEKVWGDFQQLRKAKRAPLTDTALEGIESEAKKAGITLQDALETCCLRGWQGYEAAWIKPNGSGHSNADEIAKAKAKLFGNERDISDEASRV